MSDLVLDSAVDDGGAIGVELLVGEIEANVDEFKGKVGGRKGVQGVRGRGRLEGWR